VSEDIRLSGRERVEGFQRTLSSAVEKTTSERVGGARDVK
jgi:hypothetical protein